MKKDGSDHEWLSFAPVPRDVICGHFANIRARCLEDGRDIVDEPIPVVPTQHYFMGGVWVNRDSATSMPGLYAAGETSCNGVHGKNRLASNSLLESLVFARRAAYSMAHGTSWAWSAQASRPSMAHIAFRQRVICAASSAPPCPSRWRMETLRWISRRSTQTLRRRSGLWIPLR